MSGIVVYVKQNIAKYVTRLHDYCEFAIFLKIDKCLFNKDDDITICFAYLPPEQSTYYEGKISKELIC